MQTDPMYHTDAVQKELNIENYVGEPQKFVCRVLSNRFYLKLSFPGVLLVKSEIFWIF